MNFKGFLEKLRFSVSSVVRCLLMDPVVSSSSLHPSKSQKEEGHDLSVNPGI